ncbi:hypothetical protein BN1012_Phect1815 [Candidatus Phaeomarinobacter ectocarpi]|uniref:Uncharacterized protein n=1 Tax=Candidatus Phaeomarinibacter ectocarpi TaxID=1458461 RepID=X5MFP4_9HYPH|nr:hypothetical protein BN1012_Phect1815 [Candidatus Phaeomarinobacter ectocarpi]
MPLSIDAALFKGDALAVQNVIGTMGAGNGSGTIAGDEAKDVRGIKSREEKKRDEASLNRTLLQIQLQEQYDELIDRQNWLADEMERLKGEIGAIDREISFLQQFQSEDDMLDENGALKPEIERYLRERGKNPDEMTPHEAWLLMQQREANSHDARAEKVDEYNDHAEESRANAEKLDQIEDRAATAGVDIDSTKRPDVEAVKPLVREYAPGDAADVELLSWIDDEKAAIETAADEVHEENQLDTVRRAAGFDFNGIG